MRGEGRGARDEGREVVPAEPREALLRWGVLCAWLREWGIGEWRVKRLVRDGAIRRIRLDGRGRAFYSKREVRAFLEGLE
jgi:hypothetical protein